MVVVTYGVSKIKAKTKREAQKIYKRDIAHPNMRLLKITKGPHGAFSGGHDEMDYYVAHWKETYGRGRK